MNDDEMENRILPPAEQCIYTSCYCEENVWKLCEYVRNNSPEKLQNCFAVFISNVNKKIPLWYQRAAASDGEAVIWDYHVIFVHCNGNAVLVYDLDTTLQFPSNFNSYSSHTFKCDQELKPEFRRCFRVIPASVFLSAFASNRSHMKGSDGEWLKKPPDYPCIRTEDDCNNLASFIDMECDKGLGQVLTLDGLQRIFSE